MGKGLIASCLGIALLAIAVPISLLWATPACADSWNLPETATYFSPGKKCRLTVVPRDLDSQLGYFEDKVPGKDNAGQRPDGNTRPRATLERLGADGKWQRVWVRDLVNEVGPVEALISEDMRHVVTLDNWASMGYGDDAIVIYDVAAGNVRKLSLEKLFGAEFFDALPHSVSSVWWRDGARIENGSLILTMIAPGEEPFEPGKRLKLAIDLVTGAPSERGVGAWRDARIAAANAKAAERKRIDELRIFRAAPLVASKQNDEPSWHGYLREAFRRLDPDWIEGYPDINVLRAPGNANYAASIPWIADSLRDPGNAVMFAGVDASALLSVLEQELGKLPSGSLGNARVYVVAPVAAHARLTAMFAGKGGTLILLDPTKGIPQRPQMMPRADGSLPYISDFQNG